MTPALISSALSTEMSLQWMFIGIQFVAVILLSGAMFVLFLGGGKSKKFAQNASNTLAALPDQMQMQQSQQEIRGQRGMDTSPNNPWAQQGQPPPQQWTGWNPQDAEQQAAASPWGQPGIPQSPQTPQTGGFGVGGPSAQQFAPWQQPSQAQPASNTWGGTPNTGSSLPLQQGTNNWGMPASGNNWGGPPDQGGSGALFPQQGMNNWSAPPNQAGTGMLSQQQSANNWGAPPNQGWGAFSNSGGIGTMPPQQMPGFGNGAAGFGPYAPPMQGNMGPMQPEMPGKGKGKKGKRKMFVTLSIVLVALIVLGGGGLYAYRLIKHSHPALTALTTVADISLGNGPPTRFDYQSMDAQRGLLLMSRSGANTVLIFNINSRKVVAEIPNVKDGHGVVSATDVGRIYAAAGSTNEVVVIDETTFKTIARIKVGAGPDGVAYDPVDHEIFVSNETGDSDSVINVLTDKVVATIPLGGDVGNTQYDPTTDTIYVNVETKSVLAAINPKTNQVVARYPLAGCQSNHGMNIDSVNRLMFIACVDNTTLIEINMKNMQIVDHSSIGNGADVLALDQSRHVLYVASESGVVSIFIEKGMTMHKLAEGYIAPHAHTVGVDQTTHLVYLPLENLNNHPVIRIASFTPPSGS